MAPDEAVEYVSEAVQDGAMLALRLARQYNTHVSGYYSSLGGQ